MSRPKILLICYYFPPLGGAGVTRPLALFKHLPEYGYDCHVLTVKPVAYRLFEPELLDGLSTEHIYRAGSLDPQRLMYLLGMRRVASKTISRGRAVSDRFFPDSKVAWVRRAVRLGRDLLNNRDYHAVISTSPPVSCHLVARQLAGDYNIPWIADFRDYWTAYQIEIVYPDSRRIERGKKLLAAIGRETAHITAINRTIGQYVGADEIVYNSFDTDLAQRWRLPDNREQYVIGILGTLNEIYPVEPLLKVLATLRDKNPEVFARVRLLQVGNYDPAWLLPQLEKYSLADKCELKSFQPRAKTIDLLSQTSLLYVGLPSAKEKGFSTGRIYTMIASGRPILAAVPPGGEIERLIDDTGNGFCFFDHNYSDAVDYIARQATLFEKGESSVVLTPDYARKYSSTGLAERFGEIMDTLKPPARS